jgi:4-diphosphocytidyl-2C-methyl-D-erythritol kinase
MAQKAKVAKAVKTGKKTTKKAKTVAKTKTQKTKKVVKKATKKVKKAARRGALGCCTLTGSGPAIQIEHITKEDCRQRAIELGKNDFWVKGECAESV